ncbi:MAG TPA: AAA family ATPase [Candidatus Binatia bacterium]|nr:AAA family ATPase [Candidatus Binatia bacterium]
MRRGVENDHQADVRAIRFEPHTGLAWHGDRPLDLTPKAFTVLRHLVERAGRLVTKQDLLTAAWGDTVVSEAALTSCIRDLRRALGDSSREPRYLETVHRRGFRFIGRVHAPAPVGPAVSRARPIAQPRGLIVGREAELDRLHAAFDAAAGGRRRVVFVTGEAGIGKTTLVERFLAELGERADVCVGRGQCVEQYGIGEPYMPILEALGRLGREAGGERLVATLRRYAPAWLAHLPGLLSDHELDAVQRRVHSTTRDRKLLELIEALDAFSVEAPLVLLLEDLHWSDSATIDLLATLARRRDSARLLAVATYRPAEVAASGHPLKAAKQELHLHGHCDELVLPFLGEGAIERYLAERFATASFPSSFARALDRNTSGNPLFLVNVIDDLIARGEVREVDGGWVLGGSVEEIASAVPGTLWQMVDKQVERLTDREKAVLTVASVAGVEFSAALAADGIDPDDAERCCDALARRGQFLRAIGVAEWPDGTVASRYAFIHALYRNVLYERASIVERIGLHLRIGARLEAAYGTRAAEIAGELAMHFEEGRDFERAVEYRRAAADVALRLHAYREAADHATRALELLGRAPESTTAVQQEVAIRTILGSALIAKGWAAPEVAQSYARARELGSRSEGTPESFAVLIGLFGFHMARFELGIARDLAEQMAAMATTTDDAAVRLGASSAAGMISFSAGDYPAALAHLERAITIYHPEQHSPNSGSGIWVGQDLGVSCAVNAAWIVWHLGFPERAVMRMNEAIALGHAIAHPFSLVLASHIAAAFYESIDLVDAAREVADVASLQSAGQGFDMFTTLGAFHRGWLRLQAGEGEAGTEDMRGGLAAYRAAGAGFGVPTFLGLLAEAYGRAGRPDDGRAIIEEASAMVEESGAHYWDAELRRVDGELILQGARTGRPVPVAARRDAEARFLEAIEIARRQEARMFELRAATSLARLWQGAKKSKEARDLLSKIYGWFTEGFETSDLRAARSLLDALA